MSWLLLGNWQRKVLSIITALIIWLFVNHSITETKTIPNVPVRIINPPSDKTIVGLLPNGTLKKRMGLVLSGSKDIIDNLEPGDLEIVIDASMIDRDDWIVNISKKNLRSLISTIDLPHHITNVSYGDFVIKLTPVVTMQVPIVFLEPTGEAPEGYEFLGIWPERLNQSISGPAEEIQKLKNKGMKVSFDLSKIKKEVLDQIYAEQKSTGRDEIFFQVPSEWKKVQVNFRNNALEDMNDPDADHLRIEFLKKDVLPIDRPISTRVFYPLETLSVINPELYPLAPGGKISVDRGVFIFNFPVFMRNISRHFLDVIRGNLEIVLIARPKLENTLLNWATDVVNVSELEDIYVTYMVTNESMFGFGEAHSYAKKREEILRDRFRMYLERVSLWVTPKEKLNIEATLENKKIIVK